MKNNLFFTFYFLLFSSHFPLLSLAEPVLDTSYAKHQRPLAVRSSQETLSEIVRKIEAAHETIQDLQADFRQVTRFSGFETEISSSGRLYFKKPGRLRWEYLEPNRDQVVVNQDRIWIFSPELKQVIIRPFSEFSDSQIPLRLLVEVDHLDRDFEIAWTPSQDRDATTSGEDRLTLTLRPKRSPGNIEKIEMEVDSKQYFITGINLFEENGNSSSFTFSRIKTNVGLKDKLFTFSVPKGVEVIETFP